MGSDAYRRIAAYYAAGRVAYPPASLTSSWLRWDWMAPGGWSMSLRAGILTLLLAPYVAEAIGVDADPTCTPGAKTRSIGLRGSPARSDWQLLARASPAGRFAEQMPPVATDIWSGA